jgi:hypothetical protein
MKKFEVPKAANIGLPFDLLLDTKIKVTNCFLTILG